MSGAGRSRPNRSEGQRKLSEEAITASVARLQIAMDAVLDGVSILSSMRDDDGRIIDFRIDYANAAIGEISSVPAEAQVGHTLLELFPAHRANGLFEAYVGVVETGVPFEPTDFRYADPHARGGPLDRILDQRVARLGDGCILSVRDVTEAQRVRDERERLAAIVEESPDGIVTTDYPDMRVTYANAAFADDLGREPSEVVGESVLDVAAGALDATTIAALDEVARSGRPWLGEIDWRLTDGTLGRVELRVAPRRAADGTLAGHIVVARDVTERRRIQTALELSELRYSTAFRTSPDAVNINRLTDGLYLDISDGFTAITGYTRADIEGRTSADIGIWADPGTRDRLVAGLQADGVVHNLEMRFRRKDGSLGTGLMSARLIDVNGEPCNMTITRDVTDRKEAEERFRTVFDFATDAIMISEPGGNFIEVNRTACERLGYRRDELLTMSPADISAPESAPLAAARARALMREGWASYDTGHIRRDGTVIPVEANSTVIDLGGRKSILTIARDLTDFKRAQAERLALEDQLRQSQKMEAIGQLAGGIAHDFNNLLTAIRGSASLALAELPPGEGPREDLEAIEQAADRAAGLTRQLLAFARRTVLQPEVVSLSSIVNGLESMLRRLIGENVRLVTVTPQNTCCVLADPGQLEQVILNLAVNARDAMPDGGTLTIETADLAEPSLAGPMTTLSVTDTGIGMNAETMGHLFEPFFTTKDPGKGTGLGLSAAYGIVSASGGTIKARSDLGKGSTFKVFLPRVEGAIPRGPEPPRSTASRGVKTGTILLVEDDAGVRSFANRVLQTAGYRVLSAGDGTSAIETSRDEPVQLLLTDMVMPGMSGREVAARLVSAQPGIQVLYMSGYMDKGIVHDGTLQPGIELLAKPFTAEALLQAVDRAMARFAAE